MFTLRITDLCDFQTFCVDAVLVHVCIAHYGPMRLSDFLCGRGPCACLHYALRTYAPFRLFVWTRSLCMFTLRMADLCAFQTFLFAVLFEFGTSSCVKSTSGQRFFRGCRGGGIYSAGRVRKVWSSVTSGCLVSSLVS